MPKLKAGPILEVVTFAGSILTFIWWLQPLDSAPVTFGFYIFIVLFCAASNLRHRDSAARLGFRIDTFAAAVKSVAVPTVVAIAAFLLAGWIFDSTRHTTTRRVLLNVVAYSGWGLVQQYGLQAIVLLRLQDAGIHHRAVRTAAILFALMHVPNPGLMALTLAGGLIWCRSFERHPNLFALAISHALTAVAASLTLPSWFISGLHVGPGYFRR
jgi:membrane protease YdiL (CAAX protease family)